MVTIKLSTRVRVSFTTGVRIACPYLHWINSNPNTDPNLNPWAWPLCPCILALLNECATAFAQIVCYGQYGRPYPSKQLGFLFFFQFLKISLEDKLCRRSWCHRPDVDRRRTDTSAGSVPGGLSVPPKSSPTGVSSPRSSAELSVLHPWPQLQHPVYTHSTVKLYDHLTARRFHHFSVRTRSK